ncbi:hypothetical protein GGI10_000202 [Coemansia sp. RSA 2530]|nr:hypothetical protein GGI06_000461 [Coemansia sp. S85]KAJ2417407.1 hypothetical protein GGI10_000202 [Coemansia sp. RSA 2530]
MATISATTTISAVTTDTLHTATGTSYTRGADTNSPAAVSTAVICPESAWADRGIGPDIDVVCADMSVGPDQATAFNVSVSTTGHSDRHSGGTGVVTTSGLEFGTQPSMSVGAEAAGHVAQSVSRQPKPLITQSIACTMAGTYMHMYTSTRHTHSSGREQRHLRHMWVNPFAKTLNWTNESPSEGAGLPRDASHGSTRTEFMNSVYTVHERPTAGDGKNGEPEYCIVVCTGHGELKVKARTQADHEVWYRAMAYVQTRRVLRYLAPPTN